MTEDADRRPVVRASDADREAVVARLQTALAEGRIDVDEFAERAGTASAAVTTAELAELVADLPDGAAAPAASGEVVGARRPERVTSLFGDVDVVVDPGVDAELSGWTVFGDKRTELAPVPRAAGTPRVVVSARTVFGDLRVRSLAPGEPVKRSWWR